MRSYFNNIIYTGGLINKSAKLDILCMVAYLLILFVIIKDTQVYAIPVATTISCLVFLVWYLRIMKKDLLIDTSSIVKIAFTSMMLIIPFLIVHFVLALDYNRIFVYAIYFVLFSILYCAVVYIFNKELFKQIINKVTHK